MQFAYHSFHSTETVTLSVYNDLVRATDRGQVSACAVGLPDVTAGSKQLNGGNNLVDHEILLSFMSERFSLTDTVFDWCQFYLDDQTQSFSNAYTMFCSIVVD